jgi:hypothetical protein
LKVKILFVCDILMRGKPTRGVFESLEDKVDLTAKRHDPLKFRVENYSEENGVLWIRETGQEILFTCFACWGGGDGRGKGDVIQGK